MGGDDGDGEAHLVNAVNAFCPLDLRLFHCLKATFPLQAFWHVDDHVDRDVIVFFDGGSSAGADSLFNAQGKADAADGLDDALGLDLFKLAPQIAHIHIDHVVVAEVVLTPDVLDQLGAA